MYGVVLHEFLDLNLPFVVAGTEFLLVRGRQFVVVDFLISLILFE
jgi:hypothetical protein